MFYSQICKGGQREKLLYSQTVGNSNTVNHHLLFVSYQKLKKLILLSARTDLLDQK